MSDRGVQQSRQILGARNQVQAPGIDAGVFAIDETVSAEGEIFGAEPHLHGVQIQPRLARHEDKACLRPETAGLRGGQAGGCQTDAAMRFAALLVPVAGDPQGFIGAGTGYGRELSV